MKKFVVRIVIVVSILFVVIQILPGLMTPPAVEAMLREIDGKDALPGEILEDIKYKSDFPLGTYGLDIYYPLIPAADKYKSYNSDLAPVLVFIHGGSWLHGDKSLIRIIDPFIQSVRENGIALVSIDYTAGLAGGLKKPVENCRDAISWLSENGGDYGLNTKAMGLYGASAGAHLAMMSIPSIIDNPELEIKFLLEEFGPVDLNAMAAGDAFEASALIDFFPESVLKSYSPLFLVDENWPPVLMFHGTADTTVSINQTRLLADKLAEKDIPYTFQLVPGGDHGFFNMPQEYWRELERECLEFMLPLLFPEESFYFSQ